MALVTAAAMQRKTGQVDTDKIAALKAGIVDRFERQMSVFATSALLLDDGVIDPRDTRAVLAEVLAICREAEARTPQRLSFGVMRP
jgi:geranyl-CoA carboxylase beta subunit